jgi:hypothetical protein
MSAAIRQNRKAEANGVALAGAMLSRYDGDRLRAMLAIRRTWRTRPDAHEIEVAAVAYAWIAEKLEPAERDVWNRFHADADDVAYLARAIAGRHARHIPTARSRKVAA